MISETYCKKYSRIKKQVIAQKFNDLLLLNKCVLFFHYNGSKECNWQLVKKRISQHVKCKSLLVRSNLYSFKGVAPPVFPRGQGGEWRFLTSGPTLLVAVSGVVQMVAVMEICLSPTFLCVGGVYDNNPINHLDIRRWLQLHNKEGAVHGALMQPLAQWQPLISLLHPPIHLLRCALVPSLLLQRTLLSRPVGAHG